MPLRKQKWLPSALVLGLASLAWSPAQAQDGAANAPRRDMRAPRPNETPEERRARLLANLQEQVADLSEAQKTSIVAIYERSSDQMRAAREDKTLSPEQHEEKLRQIHAAVEAEVTPLLTEAQRAQRQQVLAKARQVRLERRQGAGEGRPRRTPAEQTEHVLEHYESVITNLSAEQKKLLYAAMLESNTKSFAARDNETLSPAERDAISVEASGESMVKINAILTPEQQVAWQKSREESRKREEQRAQALSGRAETPEQKNERLLARYTQVLPDLSEAQKTKLIEILDASTDVIGGINADDSRTLEQKKSILSRLQKKVDEQVSEVFTPAQRQKWEASQKSVSTRSLAKK